MLAERARQHGDDAVHQVPLVLRVRASSSRGVPARTKCATSAMCTPTRQPPPPGSGSTDSASSRSRAVNGSMLQILMQQSGAMGVGTSGRLISGFETDRFGRPNCVGTVSIWFLSPVVISCSVSGFGQSVWAASHGFLRVLLGVANCRRPRCVGKVPF